ncbi:hypothetical protein JCM8097_005990 [Rhodosporidiobolus ruineniae]
MASPPTHPVDRRQSVQDDSAHSSPRPGSINLAVDPRQVEQDAHLAHSMAAASSHNPSRARSNTLRDRREASSASSPPEAVLTPQRTTSNSNTHPHSHEGRRTPSVSVQAGRANSGDATDAMGHLADDLAREDREEEEAQREHDEHDYRSGGGAGQGGGVRRVDDFSRQHHTPASANRSAAAAMLYRHHRNVSDSSIDSQGGAYIDHRRQPHSLSIAQVTPRGQTRTRTNEGYLGSGSARKGSGLRRFSMDPDETLARSPTSPHPLDDDPSASAFSASARAARSAPFASRDLDEDAVADDDERGPVSPRPVHFLDRQHSTKSYSSLRSRGSRTGDSDERRSTPPYGGVDMSRPGSGFGKPEDDICFPAHGAAAEMDEYMEDHPPVDDAMGMPGVLPNFPYPFDFGALEEFAVEERQGLPMGRRRRQQQGAAMGTSPGAAAGGEYGVSSATPGRFGGMGGAALSSSSEGEVPRMGGRHRKLSESVAPGRYRRKLAQFEGTGDDLGLGGGGGGAGGPPDRAPGSPATFVNIMDTKTPLLGAGGGIGDKRRGSGYGAAAGGGLDGGRKPGGPRPFRFSFYSNSLPSTIHARSLAELPAEGQSFEELFVGRRFSTSPAQQEEETCPITSVGLDARLAELRSPENRGGTPLAGVGGASTPTTASMRTSGRAGQGGAFPAGIAAAAQALRGTQPMMRSDDDAEANTWWLDVMCPTDQEMKALSKVFGIHPLTTEDIQMEETREKIELFRNYYFVCFRSFEQDPYSPTYLEPLNMYIIVFREGTLSNVRRRIKQLKDYINVTSDWISYALIDDITDAFGPLIQNIEYEVDSIDELVLILKEAEQSDMLRRIGTCRKKVMGLLRLMGNKADVVKGLSKRCNENWSVAPKSDIGLYLSDIQDHITTSTQNLTHYEKILSRSHSNYLAQISIEMTDANNQINDVLSKLTALGTVLIPMNLVTGLWGMNVHVPGQADEGSLAWFFGILGCLGAIALGGAFLTYKARFPLFSLFVRD